MEKGSDIDTGMEESFAAASTTTRDRMAGRRTGSAMGTSFPTAEAEMTPANGSTRRANHAMAVAREEPSMSLGMPMMVRAS